MAAGAVLLITGCKLQQDNVCQSARARRKKPKAIHQQSFVCTLLSLRTDWTRSCGDIIINQTTPGARVIWAIITFLPSAGRYIYVDSFPFCQTLLKKDIDKYMFWPLEQLSIYPILFTLSQIRATEPLSKFLAQRLVAWGCVLLRGSVTQNLSKS